MRNICILGLTLGLSFTAVAENPETRQLIECAPGKSFTKIANAIGDLKADKTDTINTNPSFTLQPRDGGELPKRVFIRAVDGDETALEFSKDGEVTNFIAEFEDTSGKELCVEDPVREGAPKTEDAYALNMRFNMNFLNSSGVYGMDEIKDGRKDGKSALKKIIGGPGSFFVPSLTHLYVEFEDPEAEAAFQGCELARSEKKCQALEFEKLGEAYLISFDDLKDMKADQFLVDGGAHTVSPSMSKEKMENMAKPKGKADAE